MESIKEAPVSLVPEVQPSAPDLSPAIHIGQENQEMSCDAPEYIDHGPSITHHPTKTHKDRKEELVLNKGSNDVSDIANIANIPQNALQDLLRTHRSPSSPLQQQQVLNIQRSNPQLMDAFIKQRASKYKGGQSPPGGGVAGGGPSPAGGMPGGMPGVNVMGGGGQQVNAVGGGGGQPGMHMGQGSMSTWPP